MNIADGAARLRDVVDVRVGGGFVVALEDDGSVWTWGYNGDAQLGRGFEDAIGTFVAEPGQVAMPLPARSIAAGAAHACALLTDGTAVCWGRSYDGQLGNGPAGALCWHLIEDGLRPQDSECTDGSTGESLLTDRAVPVASFDSGIELVVGSQHFCGRRESGAVDCWGRIYALGIGTMEAEFRPSAAPVPDVDDVVALWALPAATVARREDGTAVWWGVGEHALLVGMTNVAKEASILEGIEGMGAFVDTACILRAGSVACGHGDNPSQMTRVAGLDDIVDIGVTQDVSCALGRDGRAFCWGADLGGLLGRADVSQSVTPIEVSW